MGLRYEAWTTPWNPAGFKRKVAKIPVVLGTGQGTKGLFSTGNSAQMQVAINQAWNRIDEIIGEDINSLIRVYDGSTIIDEWVADRVPQNLGSESRHADVSGWDLKGVFDRYIIYPREYPDVISPNQDTIWGGEQALDDPSFEDVAVTREVYEVWKTTRSGTFTLTVLGQTTPAMAFNIGSSALETNLQNLSTVDDVVVTVNDAAGSDPGSEADKWQIEFVSPAVLSTNMTGSGGGLNIDLTQNGIDNEPSSWTKSQFADERSDPRLHGRYASDGFRIDTSRKRTGDTSLRINGLTRYAGAQQVINVEPGMTYQCGIWINSDDTDEIFKLVIRDIYDNPIPLAQDGGSVSAANTWTLFNFELFISPFAPPAESKVIFRVAAVGKANPNPYWIDDAFMNFGFAATDPGEIMKELLDDAAVDHAGDDRGAVLDWIDYSTIDGGTDSGGNPYSDTISFTAQYGETYGQVLDKMVDLGFEWDLVPKSVPSGGKTHDFLLYNSGGRDSAPGRAITARAGTLGGEVIERSPDFTAVFIEGATSFQEIEDASAVDFGRFETFVAARDVETNDQLVMLATQVMNEMLANRRAVRFEMADVGLTGIPRPLVDFKPGDTMKMQAGGMLVKESRRVQEVSYVNTEPTTYVIVGSRALAGEAAAWDLVRRLWRRFKRPDIPLARGRADAFGNGGGLAGTPTYFIAPSDAPDIEKEKADFVCIGTTSSRLDHLDIQRFIDQIDFSGGKGRIKFGSGTFWVQGGNLVFGDDKTIEGTGNTRFTGGSTTGAEIFNIGSRCVVRDIEFTGQSGVPDGIAILGLAVDTTIERCRFDLTTLNNAIEQGSGSGAERIKILNCTSTGAGEADLFFAWSSDIYDLLIRGCHISGDIGIQLVSGDSYMTITDNVIYGSIDLQTTDRGLIANNTIISGQAAISLNVATHVVISDNWIESDWTGIDMINADSCLILDNYFTMPALDANNTYDGIKVDSDSDNVTIQGNRIMGAPSGNKPRYGINIANSNCINTRVFDNFIDLAANFATARIQDLGTDSVWGSQHYDTYGKQGTLTTGTGVQKLPFTQDAVINRVKLAVGTAPTGQAIIVDVNKNGTSIYPTSAKPQIAASATVGANAVPDTKLMANGDYLTIDIDQIGSGTAGADLTVVVEWAPA